MIELLQKSMVACEVVILSSVSDATLMLDFFEVQHLKLNRQSPESRPQA